MSSVTQSSPLSPEHQNFFKTHTDTSTMTSAGKIKSKTQAKADLTIVTEEGDKVTLSAKSVLRTVYTTYNAQGHLQSASGIQAETLKLSVKNKISVSVEGNLNAEEQADIEQLLGRLSDIATDFFAGDLEEALAGALDLDELDSIARFTAKLKFKQHVSLKQLHAVQSLADDTPETSPAGQGTIPQAQTYTGVDKVVDNMIQAVRESNVAMEELAHRLPGMVSELFENLVDQFNLDEPQRQLAAHVSSKFSQRFRLTVRSGSSEDESASPAVKVDVETKASQRLKLSETLTGSDPEAADSTLTAVLKTKVIQWLKFTAQAKDAEIGPPPSASVSNAKAKTAEPSQVGEAPSESSNVTPSEGVKTDISLPLKSNSQAGAPPGAGAPSAPGGNDERKSPEAQSQPTVRAGEQQAESPHAVIMADFRSKFSQRFRLNTEMHNAQAGAARYRLNAELATRFVQHLKIA